jgi:hypothetical protein
MDFKKLEKANKIYQEIKALDKEIIEIENNAMLIANGDVKLSLTLNINDLTKKAEAESKVAFDEDGSLIINSSTSLRSLIYNPFFSLDGGSATEEKKEDNKHKYSSDIKENEALQILGILLYVRQTKRQQLINRLNKMGVVNQ